MNRTIKRTATLVTSMLLMFLSISSSFSPMALAAPSDFGYSPKTPSVRIALSASRIKAGDTFEAAFWLQGFVGDYRNVQGVEFHVTYDPKLIQPVLEGETGKLDGLFPEKDRPITWANLVDKEGHIRFAQTLPPQSTAGFTGSRKIGVVAFRAVKEGTAAFTMDNSFVIMPGSPGVNIKHTFNGPAVVIGLEAPSSGAVPEAVVSATERLQSVGNAPAAIGKKPAEEVIARFADAKEFAAVPWSVEAVAALTDYGYLNGDAAGAFHPRRPMTRAEFAVLAVSAMGLDMQQRMDPDFTDAAPSDWFFDAVETAVAHGLITGYTEQGEKRFKPHQTVTRAEIAAILSKWLAGQKKKPPTDTGAGPELKDVPVSHWAYGDIVKLYGFGVLGGVGGGRFAPKASATRAEVSVMLHKLLLIK